MIRDHDRARFFGHLHARLGRVGALLLSDDRVVAKLLQLLELFGPRLVITTQGVRRDPTHAATYTEKPSRRQSRDLLKLDCASL